MPLEYTIVCLAGIGSVIAACFAVVSVQAVPVDTRWLPPLFSFSAAELA